MKCKDFSKEQIKAINCKPGAAVDAADDCRVDKQAVKDYTRELNDNPRNDEVTDDTEPGK